MHVVTIRALVLSAACGAMVTAAARSAGAAPVTMSLGSYHLIDTDPSETAGSYYDLDFDSDGTIDINLYHQFLYTDGDPSGAYSDVIGGDSCVGGCGPAPTGPAIFSMYQDPALGDEVFAEPFGGPFGSSSSGTSTYAMFFDTMLNAVYENPWLTSGTSFLTGLFTIGDYYHPFFVEMSVDSGDGSLTLVSAGFDTTAVPEPASLLLLGGGLAAMARRRRKALPVSSTGTP